MSLALTSRSRNCWCFGRRYGAITTPSQDEMKRWMGPCRPFLIRSRGSECSWLALTLQCICSHNRCGGASGVNCYFPSGVLIIARQMDHFDSAKDRWEYKPHQRKTWTRSGWWFQFNTIKIGRTLVLQCYKITEGARRLISKAVTKLLPGSWIRRVNFPSWWISNHYL